MQNEVTLVKQYTSLVLVIHRTNFWLLSLFTDLISYNTVSASLASVIVVDRSSDGQQGPCGDTILIFLKNSIYKDTEMLEVKKVSETILNVALFVTSSLLVKKITPKSNFLHIVFLSTCYKVSDISIILLPSGSRKTATDLYYR